MHHHRSCPNKPGHAINVLLGLCSAVVFCCIHGTCGAVLSKAGNLGASQGLPAGTARRMLQQPSASNLTSRLVLRSKAVPTLCLDVRNAGRLQQLLLYPCDANPSASQTFIAAGLNNSAGEFKLLDVVTKRRAVQAALPPSIGTYPHTVAQSLLDLNGVAVVLWDASSRRGTPPPNVWSLVPVQHEGTQLRLSIKSRNNNNKVALQNDSSSSSQCLGVVGHNAVGGLLAGLLACDTRDPWQLFSLDYITTGMPPPVAHLVGIAITVRPAALPGQCWTAGGDLLACRTCSASNVSQSFTLLPAPGQPTDHVMLTQQVSGVTRMLVASNGQSADEISAGASLTWTRTTNSSSSNNNSNTSNITTSNITNSSTSISNVFVIEALVGKATGYRLRLTSSAGPTSLCLGVDQATPSGVVVGLRSCAALQAVAITISADDNGVLAPGRSSMTPTSTSAPVPPTAALSALHHRPPTRRLKQSNQATQSAAPPPVNTSLAVRLLAAPSLCWDARHADLMQGVLLWPCDASVSQSFTLQPDPADNTSATGSFHVVKRYGGKNRHLCIADPLSIKPNHTQSLVDNAALVVLPAEATSHSWLCSFFIRPVVGIPQGYKVVSRLNGSRCVGVASSTPDAPLPLALLTCQSRDPHQVFTWDTALPAQGTTTAALSGQSALAALVDQTVMVKSVMLPSWCWSATPGSGGTQQQQASVVILQPCDVAQRSQAFVVQSSGPGVRLVDTSSGLKMVLGWGPRADDGAPELVVVEGTSGGAVTALAVDGGYQLALTANGSTNCIGVSLPDLANHSSSMLSGLVQRGLPCTVDVAPHMMYRLAVIQEAGAVWVTQPLQPAPVLPTPSANLLPSLPLTPGGSPDAASLLLPSSLESSSASDKGVSIPLVVGITVGVMMLLKVPCFLAWRWYRRQRAGAGKADTSEDLAQPDDHKLGLGLEGGNPLHAVRLPEAFMTDVAPFFNWLDESPNGAVPVEEGVNAASLAAQQGQAAVPDTVQCSRSADRQGPQPVELSAEDVQQQVELVATQVVGLGAVGVVFKGRWSRVFGPHGLVAVKVLRDPQGREAPRLIATIREEVALLKSCRHPNVVQMYGYCLEPPCVCIIMELLPCTLHHRLCPHKAPALQARPPTPLPPAAPAASSAASSELRLPEVLSLGRGIAEGLAFLHSKPELRQTVVQDVEIYTLPVPPVVGHMGSMPRIVHRDLKPHNVLIDSQGRPKLSDFGIARPLETTTLHTHHPRDGTPFYMAPELLLPRPYITDKVDVYSLGVILWQLGQARLSPAEKAILDTLCPCPSHCTSDTAHSDGGPHELPTVCEAWLEYMELAQACRQDVPKMRPNAAHVAERLAHMIHVWTTCQAAGGGKCA